MNWKKTTRARTNTIPVMLLVGGSAKRFLAPCEKIGSHRTPHLLTVRIEGTAATAATAAVSQLGR